MDGWREMKQALAFSLNAHPGTFILRNPNPASNGSLVGFWKWKCHFPDVTQFCITWSESSQMNSVKVRRAHSLHVLQLLNNVLLMDCHITWDVLCFVSWVTLLDLKKNSYTYSIHFD